MFLKKLSVIGFKNVKQTTLEFSSRVNCFVGDNGAGKTNLIDAIHYLSMCKSTLAMTDTQCVRHGDEFFVLDAQYSTEQDKKESVVCAFKKGSGKSIKRNGKEYDRLSDHVGLIPIVIVSPADSFLVTDSADERRKYLNSFLSQLDKHYLTSIMRYNQILNERNKLLKMEGHTRKSEMGEVMEILNQQLVEVGEIVHRHRTELIERLAPLVAEYYKELSGDREQIDLLYQSELNQMPFIDILTRNQEKDRINQYTSGGIHRDDMRMKIGGYPLRRYGSQGQQKSFLVALKLAQYSIVKQQREERPILLLDDLFDKLDVVRVEKLIELVSRDKFGQIFITDCNKERLERVLKSGGEEYALFDVNDGSVDF